MLQAETLQLGAIGIVCIVLIREVFGFLKNKKNGTSKEILKEIQLMNENHLNSICKEMNEGNNEIVKTIKELNQNLGDKLDNINTGISRLLGRSDQK